MVITDGTAWVYNLTVDEAHTYFVGNGQWLVHNCPPTGNGGGSSKRPPIASDKDEIDIVFGVKEQLEAFAQSFSNPYAYPFYSWPDKLVTLKNGAMMNFDIPQFVKQNIALVLDRLASGKYLPKATIRFNLHNVTIRDMNFMTFYELTELFKRPALVTRTKFYDGIGNELTGDALKDRLKGLGFELP